MSCDSDDSHTRSVAHSPVGHTTAAASVGYQDACLAGATAAEAQSAWDAGIPLGSYADAREAGASHDQVLSADVAGLVIDAYAMAIAAGASHTEVLEAHRYDDRTWAYARCRAAGASHKQVIGAVTAASGQAGSQMYYYVCLSARLAHDRFMAAVQRALPMRTFAWLITRSVDCDELLRISPREWEVLTAFYENWAASPSELIATARLLAHGASTAAPRECSALG